MITPEQLAASGSESGHQKALFAWCALNTAQYPQLKWLFAIPNGFFATAGQKAKMKAEGLRNGVPDMMLPVAHNMRFGTCTHLGLFIELKVPERRNQKDGGKSEDQIKWINYLCGAGYMCYTAYGWEDARDMLIAYLEGR